MQLTCVQLDWAANPLRHVKQSDWESGVWDTIREIARPGFQTGRVVLRALQTSGKTIRIVPWREPNALLRLQKETKDNPDGICVSGIGLAQAAPEKDAPDVQVRPKKGTSQGDSFVLFTAQDFRDSEQNADSTLLHELFHSLRIALGLDKGGKLEPPSDLMRHWKGSVMGKATGSDPETRYTQVYNNVEEFLAVMIQNIYDSERLRALRRDHLPPVAANGGDYCVTPGAKLSWATLGWPLSNSRNFLTIWRHQIEMLALAMRGFCDQIAPVDAHFNPIFDLYRERDWFLPGGRQVNLAHR
jgi:hypothetical protein